MISDEEFEKAVSESLNSLSGEELEKLATAADKMKQEGIFTMNAEETEAYIARCNKDLEEYKGKPDKWRTINQEILNGASIAVSYLNGTLADILESAITARSFLESDEGASYSWFPDFKDWIRDKVASQKELADVVELADLCENLKKIQPVARDIAIQWKKRHEFPKCTFKDFMTNTYHDEEATPFQQCLSDLKAEEKKSDLEKYRITDPQQVFLGLTMVQGKIFDFPDPVRGVQDASVNTAKRNSKQSIITTVKLDFESLTKYGVQVPTTFSREEERLANLLISFWLDHKKKTGKDKVTVSVLKVTQAFTGSEHPAMNQKKKVIEMAKKLACGTKISNQPEAEAYKYPRINYIGQLFPIKILYDENTGDGYINLYEEPILYRFSEGRKQLTFEPKESYHALPHTSLNDAVLQCMDKEIAMISHNSKRKKQITIDYVCDFTHSDKANRTTRSRIRSKMKAILENYAEAGRITGFEEYKKGQRIEGYKIRFKSDTDHKETTKNENSTKDKKNTNTHDN